MGTPNRLTLLRVLLTPVIAAVLLWEWPGAWWPPLAIVLIGLAAFTDLLDGFLARRRNQVTRLGILLDPIADKFFIATVFICLVAGGLAPAWVAIVIVGREFAVTALRMVALERGSSVSVSILGKAKMHLQVYAVLIVLLESWARGPDPSGTGMFGTAALWIAATVTIWSGADYFARSQRQFAAD